jgi:hypothetical protein
VVRAKIEGCAGQVGRRATTNVRVHVDDAGGEPSTVQVDDDEVFVFVILSIDAKGDAPDCLDDSSARVRTHISSVALMRLVSKDVSPGHQDIASKYFGAVLFAGPDGRIAQQHGLGAVNESVGFRAVEEITLRSRFEVQRLAPVDDSACVWWGSGI